MAETDTPYRCCLLRVALERGLRYYAEINYHWRVFDTACKAVSFLCVFVSALLTGGESSVWQMPIAVITMVILFFDLYLQPSARIAKWNQRIHDYHKLLSLLPSFDDDADMKTIADVDQRKRELDGDEKSIPCLSVAKQNEVLSALGFPGDCQAPLSFLERTLGQWLPLRYTPKPLPHLAEQVKAKIPA